MAQTQRGTAREAVDSTHESAREQRLGRRAELTVIERRSGRRRVSPTMLMGAVIAVAIAFGALGTQVSIIHRQMKLDGIRSEITQIQTSTKELHQRESRLQAPDEVRRLATTKLGMVDPRQSAFVTPTVRIIGSLDLGPRAGIRPEA